MKAIYTLLALLTITKIGVSQSPFNYGQNNKVYFVSSQQRDSLGIDSIYTIHQNEEDELGGMGENWDVMLITFGNETISDDWYPISLDSNFKFDFDSITTQMQFLNGTRYELIESQLLAYGGGGYGSFDWLEITHFSDRISIVATDCVGHCGGQPTRYSKNVFNEKGQLSYTVTYPIPAENDDNFRENNSDAESTLAQYEKMLLSNVNEDNKPDTVFYRYDAKGLFLGPINSVYIENAGDAKKLFAYSNDFGSEPFHQCYIGKEKMEKFVAQSLGFTPELLLFEIYRYGVISFAFSAADKKYYRAWDIILED